MDKTLREIVSIIKMRQRQGWTLRHIAESSGVTQQTLYNWLSGKCSYARTITITAVAEALGYRITVRIGNR